MRRAESNDNDKANMKKKQRKHEGAKDSSESGNNSREQRNQLRGLRKNVHIRMLDRSRHAVRNCLIPLLSCDRKIRWVGEGVSRQGRGSRKQGRKDLFLCFAVIALL